MDLKRYLEENKVWHRFISKPRPSQQTLESASMTGLPPERVSKSLVLLDDKHNPYIIIIPGSKKLDFAKVKAVFGLKKVHLALPDDAKNYSGYEPGETPPIHHLKPVKVGLDESFLQYETMYGGGGDKSLIVELKVSDVIRLNGAVVAKFTLE
jgi:Cys-tRNA(Pro)/Cys-tRNA(Cys) deacylase